MLRELLLQRVNVYGNEREDGLHPSQISRVPYCLKRHKLEQKFGHAVAPETQLIFNIGHVLHDFYREKYFPEIYNKEKRICFYLDDVIKVVGSMDGMIDIENVPSLVEIKSVGKDAWQMFRRPKDTHVNQMQLYMYAENLTQGVLVYINKDNGDIKEWMIGYDQELVDELLYLIREIDRVDHSDALPLEHKKCTPSSVLRKQCPFSERCFPNTTEDE